MELSQLFLFVRKFIKINVHQFQLQWTHLPASLSTPQKVAMTTSKPKLKRRLLYKLIRWSAKVNKLSR